jgi:hypothetical protein
MRVNFNRQNNTEMKTDDTTCDWCGEEYHSNGEGHTHYEDGGCECKYCLASKAIEGKNFCSQECECKYVVRYPV